MACTWIGLIALPREISASSTGLTVTCSLDCEIGSRWLTMKSAELSLVSCGRPNLKMRSSQCEASRTGAEWTQLAALLPLAAHTAVPVQPSVPWALLVPSFFE